MIDIKHCQGCVDDFYNGNNEIGVTRCWSLKTAVLVTRYRIGVWTMPLSPGAFREMRVPNCYRAQGYAFTEKPHPEAVDVVRIRSGKPR